MPDDDLHARICAKWPRLYLDTAELLNIADGTTDAVLVRELTATMKERGVLLVVSVEHMQDVLPRGDTAAADELARALERFPLRAVVLKGPEVIEPFEDGVVGDIELHAASNIREVLNVPEAQPVLERLAAVQDKIHEATEVGRASRLAHPAPHVSKGAQPLELQARITLVRGWLGEDLDAIVSVHAERAGEEEAQPSERQRAAVTESLRPLVEIMRVVGPTLEAQGVDRTEMLRTLAVAISDQGPRRSPGLFLATRVAADRARDPGRKPLRSDAVDLAHVMYLPYVDVATCDRQAHASIRTWVDKVVGPRRAAVFRNGQMSEVLAAIEKLPCHPVA